MWAIVGSLLIGASVNVLVLDVGWSFPWSWVWPQTPAAGIFAFTVGVWILADEVIGKTSD